MLLSLWFTLRACYVCPSHLFATDTHENGEVVTPLAEEGSSVDEASLIRLHLESPLEAATHAICIHTHNLSKGANLSLSCFCESYMLLLHLAPHWTNVVFEFMISNSVFNVRVRQCVCSNFSIT